MNSTNRKRDYSAIYKIYRRIRFLRYKKKSARTSRQLSESLRKAEKEDAKKKFIEFKKHEAELIRIRQKADREEQKRIKEELRSEFRLREQQARIEWQKSSHAEQEKLRARYLDEKQERKRQQKNERNRKVENLKQLFRSFSPAAIKLRIRDFRSKAPRRKLFFIISFNSTVLYLLAYIVLYLVYQAITIIAAGFFNYPVIVYYYQIFFNISPEAWYHDSVKTIFAAGPLILFIIGIIFLIIYSNLKELTGNFKLFFLWGFLHGVNMLFGALLIGTLFETGVGHVISWMYIMDTGKVLYSIFSLFILALAGLLVAKPFLISGNAYFNEVTRENRRFLLKSQVLAPYITGTIIIFLLRQPHFMYYETFVMLVLIISLLPLFIVSGSIHDLFFDEEEKKPKIFWMSVVMLIGILILYRVILAVGIRFGA